MISRRTIIYFFSFALLSWALENQSQAQLNASSDFSSENSWGALLSIENTSSLHDSNNPSFSSISTFYAVPHYRVQKDWVALAFLTFDKEWTGEERLTLRDTKLELSFNGPRWGQIFRLNPRTAIYLPTGSDSLSRESQIGRIQGSIRIPIDLKYMGYESLNGHYQVSFTRYFHEFTTTTDGKSNHRYTLAHIFRANWNWIGAFTLTAQFQYTSGWTHEGNLRNQFNLNEEISYSFTEKLCATLGHTNGGSSLKANGEDSNIAVFDENSSKLYGSLTVEF